MIVTYNLSAQNKPNTNLAAPEAYHDAVALVETAIQSLNQGEIKVADSLAKASIKVYPTLAIFKYCTEIGKLPDIVVANLIADLAIARVMEMKEVYIVTPTPFGPTFRHVVPKERALFAFYQDQYKLNNRLGNRALIIKSIRKMINLPLIPGFYGKGIDYDVEAQIGFANIEAAYSGDFDKAVQLIRAKSGKYLSSSQKGYEIAQVYMEAENYDMVIEVAKKNSNSYIKAEQLFKAYLLKGDLQNATENAAKMVPSNINKSEKSYYNALLKMLKKDYTNALSDLNSSMKQRSIDNNYFVTVVDLWRIYKAYGDAYLGLKDYEKAKDHYNIALLYDPTFKSAKDALTALGKIYSEEVNTDKTPPVIAVTEPSPTRGLKVVSAASSVMVKGTATDVSGIKEVSINGIKVFAQPNGDFWGDVPMKIGLNKILVVAIDMAGNKSEKTFDIEKSAPATTAATP
ncbi:MAG: hypothetical protein EOO07_29080, partial [Chitinophagaceae bacterium]